MPTFTAIRFVTPIAALSFVAPAIAACVKPSGTYVGAGGGPVVAVPDPAAPTTTIPMVGQQTLTLTFGAGTETRIGAGTFTFVGKAVTSPAAPDGTSTGYFQILTGGWVAPQTVVSKIPGPRWTNFFSTDSCMGIVTATGTVWVSPASTALSPESTWTNRPLKLTWSYVSSQNGSVVTVANRSDDLNMPGFSIRLERP